MAADHPSTTPAVDGPTAHEADGLAWREAGDGALVILLHGLGGTSTSWGPQFAALAEHVRVVAWDLPGYGDSSPVEPLTFSAIASRLTDLISLLGADRADLVGLSFGGMHALHTALEHPDRVRRLVLADTSPAFGLDGTTRDDWVRSRLRALDDGGTPADGAERIVDLLTAEPLTGSARADTIAAFERIGSAGFRAAVTCLPDHDVAHRLGELDHRCLVIVGELDRETPPSYAEALHAGLPNSELAILDGVGHLSPTEDPDRFNRLVLDFLTAPEFTTPEQRAAPASGSKGRP